MSDRRAFLRTSVGAGGALALGLGGSGAELASAALPDYSPRLAPSGSPSSRRIRLLILGGTGFIGPWQVRYAVEHAELPVWRPPTPGYEGFARFDLSREVAAGLTFRSLADTTMATLEYHHARDAGRRAELSAGMTLEQEAEVLRAWHAARG